MNIQQNVQLQPYNSFRTKAFAKFYCEPQSEVELSEVLLQCANEKKLIFGGGYNLFFTCDFDGMVIRPQIKGITVLEENDETVLVEAKASEDWDGFVAFCVAHGFAGVENLSLIPGTVGAAPIQNIGAYGTEVEDVVVRVNCIEIESGRSVAFDKAACRFAYRDSIFKQTKQYVVTSVVFRLSKQFVYREKYADLNAELANIASPTIAQVRDAVIRVRERKLPDYVMLPNAGSFFKNPILSADEKDSLLAHCPNAPIYPLPDNQFKTSAAFLIDSAGLKGYRKGNVGIYEGHALIIVNHGTDNGQEILAFMQEIQQTVSNKFGILLEPEVWIF